MKGYHYFLNVMHFLLKQDHKGSIFMVNERVLNTDKKAIWFDRTGRKQVRETLLVRPFSNSCYYSMMDHIKSLSSSMRIPYLIVTWFTDTTRKHREIKLQWMTTTQAVLWSDIFYIKINSCLPQILISIILHSLLPMLNVKWRQHDNNNSFFHNRSPNFLPTRIDGL